MRAWWIVLLAPAAWGIEHADSVGAGEFPALQLLPVGSEVSGISLPRYDKHRVSALLQADKLRIVSRREMELENLRATLYGQDGSDTTIRTASASYDFTTRQATAPAAVHLENPAFNAEGSSLRFDSNTGRGILLGPVRTSIFTARLPRNNR